MQRSFQHLFSIYILKCCLCKFFVTFVPESDNRNLPGCGIKTVNRIIISIFTVAKYDIILPSTSKSLDIFQTLNFDWFCTCNLIQDYLQGNRYHHPYHISTTGDTNHQPTVSLNPFIRNISKSIWSILKKVNFHPLTHNNKVNITVAVKVIPDCISNKVLNSKVAGMLFPLHFQISGQRLFFHYFSAYNCLQEADNFREQCVLRQINRDHHLYRNLRLLRICRSDLNRQEGYWCF